MFDPMQNIKQTIADSQRRMNESLNQVSQAKAQEIERQERNNELLEINVNQNEEMLRLQTVEVEFLQNIDGNTAALVQLLGDLESANQAIGSINHDHMVQIQQKLDGIIDKSSADSVSELLLEEFKKQIVEKGVSYGVQFLITGLKALVKIKTVS